MIRTMILPVLVTATLATCPACVTTEITSAEQDAFQSDDAFRSWFADYYKNADNKRVTAAVRHMRGNAYMREYPDISSVFLGRVFAANGGSLPDWASSWRDLDSEAWDVLLVAFWLSDTAEGRQIARANTERASKAQRGRIEAMLRGRADGNQLIELKISHARHINLLWAAFSATGDERYILRIIDQAGKYATTETRDVAARAIGEAALMSLAVNVAQHVVVEKICRRESTSHPDRRTRVALSGMFEVLAQIAEEKRQDSRRHHPGRHEPGEARGPASRPAH